MKTSLTTGALALTASLLSTGLLTNTAYAVALIDGMSGETTYGNRALNDNDDGSSNLLNLPFEINFYGNRYTSFYINNNGNISFEDAISEYTPDAFPIADQPMIAPFWGDVDTRCDACGDVYLGGPNEDTVVVTWNDVGYYSASSDKTNNFQLALRNQGNGDFDIEFRFDRLEWTTGDASGGTDGLGGTPAQSGFDAGNQQDYFALPGSRTGAVLDLANTTNVVGGEAGLWSFAIRNGVTPGETPENPLMPVIVDGAFTFDFNIDLNEQIFVDPEVAIGYDYEVLAGPNFASVLLPTGFGDDQYELWVDDGTGNYVLLTALAGGELYVFDDLGLDAFRILGIEPELGVDPTDGGAFVTGLTFVAAGQVSMTQTPLTANVDGPARVPEPGTALLMLLGSAFLLRRRQH